MTWAWVRASRRKQVRADILAFPLPVSPESSNKFNYSRFGLSVFTTQPAFIEWQRTIHRPLLLPKIFRLKAQKTYWGESLSHQIFLTNVVMYKASEDLIKLFRQVESFLPFLLFQSDHQLVKSHNPVLTHKPLILSSTLVPHCSFRIEYCPSKCSSVSRLVVGHMQLIPAV